MLAMLTPASPRIVPTRPIIPGWSSFTTKSIERLELDLDLVAERVDEPRPVSRPIVVPATVKPLRSPETAVT